VRRALSEKANFFASGEIFPQLGDADYTEKNAAPRMKAGVESKAGAGLIRVFRKLAPVMSEKFARADVRGGALERRPAALTFAARKSPKKELRR